VRQLPCDTVRSIEVTTPRRLISIASLASRDHNNHTPLLLRYCLNQYFSTYFLILRYCLNQYFSTYFLILRYCLNQYFSIYFLIIYSSLYLCVYSLRSLFLRMFGYKVARFKITFKLRTGFSLLKNKPLRNSFYYGDVLNVNKFNAIS